MPARRARSLVGVAVVVTVALAAGCGGGSDSEPPSPAEFRNEANAVCREARTTLADITMPSSPDEFVTSLEMALPLQEELIDDLRDVDAPEELTERYSDALALLSEQRSLGQQALDDIEGGGDPVAVITTLGPEIQRNEARLDEVALELGLVDCAGGEPAAGSA